MIDEISKSISGVIIKYLSLSSVKIIVFAFNSPYRLSVAIKDEKTPLKHFYLYL